MDVIFVERRNREQVFDFTVYSKNLSFTRRLSGYFWDVQWNQRVVRYHFSKCGFGYSRFSI